MAVASGSGGIQFREFINHVVDLVAAAFDAIGPGVAGDAGIENGAETGCARAEVLRTTVSATAIGTRSLAPGSRVEEFGDIDWGLWSPANQIIGSL